MRRTNRSGGSVSRVAGGLALMLGLLHWSIVTADEPQDVRAALDRAVEVSYQDHWRNAQALLDDLAPLIDQAELREYADFHLLEARHLALADRSREGLDRAMSLLELDLPTGQRLRALQFAANISVLLRRYEAAFEFLGEGLQLDPQTDDTGPRIATFNMAAYMFGRVGEHQAGIEFGELALALAQESGDLNQACVARQRLAPVYKWAGESVQAEQVYRRGIADCQAVGNTLFVGVLQHGLADLLRPQRPGEALVLADEAIAALVDSVYPLGEFEARMVRAEVLHDLGLLGQEEEPELAELAAYFGERELWDQQARLEWLQARQAEQRAEFETALVHLRAYLQARESFLGRDRAMRLAYLQVEFESRSQQQEIELLRETARVAQLEAEAAAQQRRVRTFALLSLGLTLALALVLLFRVVRSRLRFRDLSRQDRLSGLVNHSWFFEQGQRVLQTADRDDSSGVVVMVLADIDHFKQVNDIHGHRVGDEVIGRTARRLREVFPEPALVGRIGGEEFAILVRMSDLDQVLARIEQFRQADPDGVRAGDPDVTLSFGLACFRAGDDLETLRDRADQALYQAKRDGRDCYRLDASCGAPARAALQ